MYSLSGKTVLVTGATGLIGSHLIHELMQMDKMKVISLSRSEKKMREIFSDYVNNDNFKIIAQDISQELCSDIGNVDYIFHAASPIEGNIITNYPMNVISPNLFGTINCLDYLKNQGDMYSGRLILFSSATVYANNTDKDITVSEKDTCVTDQIEYYMSAYSQSKRMTEVISQAYRKQYGTDVVIARLGYVYGDTYFVPDTAVFSFIQSAARRENIILFSDTNPRRDNIYVKDAVNGLLCIAEKGVCGEAYNISSGGDGGNFAALDEIGIAAAQVSNKILNGNIYAQYKQEGSANRKPGIRLCNEKLKKLGWEVTTGLYEGLEKTIAYFNEHKPVC